MAGAPECPECGEKRMVAAATDMMVDVEATKARIMQKDANQKWQFKPGNSIHHRCIKCDHFWVAE